MLTDTEFLEGLETVESALGHLITAIFPSSTKEQRVKQQESLTQTKKYNLRNTLLLEYDLFHEDPETRIGAIVSFVRDLQAILAPSTDPTTEENQKTLIQIFRGNFAARLASTAPANALSTKEDILAYYKEFIADALFKSIYGHYPADRATTIQGITSEDKIERLTKEQLERIYKKLGISLEKELFGADDFDAIEERFHASNLTSIMETMSQIAPSALGIRPSRETGVDNASVMTGASFFAASHLLLNYLAPTGINAFNSTIPNAFTALFIGLGTGTACNMALRPLHQQVQLNSASRSFVSLSSYEYTVAHYGATAVDAETAATAKNAYVSEQAPHTDAPSWTGSVALQSGGATRYTAKR